MQIVKNLVRAIFNKAGVDIRRRKDPYQLSLYKELFDEETLAKKPFYNIGAGSFWHPYWTNIDYVSDWYGVVQKDVVHHDLMLAEPLLFESDSAISVYVEAVKR